MSVLEVFSAGGAGLSSARPVLMPLMNSEENKSPRVRKVNPKYAGVEHIRRLFYPEESKVAPALPGTKIQAMDESVKRERKSSIAIQVGTLLLKSRRKTRVQSTFQSRLSMTQTQGLMLILYLVTYFFVCSSAA